MKRSRVLVVTVLIAVFALLIGGVQAQDANVFRFAVTQEPGVLIDYFSDLGISWSIMRVYAQPQWGTMPDGTVVGTLIDELPSTENGGLSQTEDGKTVVKFTIADWAVWSDGTPITAADFILVYDVATDGVSNVLSFRFVNGATLDSVAQGATDKEVVITFAQSQPDWTSASIVPLPAHILREPYEAALTENKGMDTLVDYLRAPTVGNGPFVFAEWQSGSFIRFTRNENYWKTPYFDEVVISFYPDNNVIEQLLIAGETDATFAIPFLQAVALVNNNPSLQLQTSFSGGRMELRINMGPEGFPALKDVNVRKALEMGIDRQFIVDNLYDGQTKVPRSFWDDTPWFFEGTPVIGYDEAGAIALLAEAGWSDDDGDGVVEAHGVEGVEDGTPFILTGATYAGGGFTEYQDVLLTVQDMLSKIGVLVETINLYEVNVMHSTLTSGSPYALGADDLYVQGWGVGVETIDQLELYACDAIPTDENPSGWNGVHICSEEMDNLWDVLGTSLDPAERQEAANQIQTIMAEEVLTIYTVNLNDAFVLNGNIEGFEWGGGGTPWIKLADLSRSEA
jgi:peptide/nickel transport system substrate-binding protein